MQTIKKFDVIDHHGEVHRGVPFFFVREATREEYLRYHQDVAPHVTDVAPGPFYYEVHTD